jgi:gas vesicle protein
MNNSISGFLVGVGIGCGIVAFLTSRSGRMLRAQMLRRARRGVNSARRSGTELCDQAFDLARKSSQAIATQRDALAAGLEAGRRAYTRVVRA